MSRALMLFFIANRVKPRNTKSFNSAFNQLSWLYIIDFATDDLLHSIV
jgi:hypothetical protein